MRKIGIITASAAVGVFVGAVHHEKVEFALQQVSGLVSGKGRVDVARIVSDPEAFLEKVTELTNKRKYAILSTTCANSSTAGARVVCKARTIQPYPVERDANNNPVIYFNTNKFSRKIEEINANPNVCLTYFDEEKMACVNFEGVCERVPYPESTLHWREWLRMFYPEGPDETKGSRITTWRIKANRIQLLAFHEGIVSNRVDTHAPEIALNQSTGTWETVK